MECHLYLIDASLTLALVYGEMYCFLSCLMWLGFIKQHQSVYYDKP